MFASVVCANFANETRWYTNHEICTVDSSQLFSMFYVLLEMVMSGINDVRRHQHCCTVCGEKTRDRMVGQG